MAESLGNRQLSCPRGGQGARQSAATARAGPMRRHHVCHCRAPSKWRPTTRTLWPGALILLVTEEKDIHMPSSASACAMLAPMPLDAPVTTPAFPTSFLLMPQTLMPLSLLPKKVGTPGP